MNSNHTIDVEVERKLCAKACEEVGIGFYPEIALLNLWLAAKRSIAQPAADPAPVPAQAGTTAKAEGWISEHDARRPRHGEPILMFIRTIHYGESDEGHLTSQEGQEIAMGEYRKSEHGDYFDCYASPMSDNDWITHWQPLPAPPAAPATTETPCKKN